MFHSYLKTAFRSVTKHLHSSVINVIGMAIGISSFIFIALFIQSELSYDTHWKNYRQIYRISETIKYPEREDPFAPTCFGLAEKLKHKFGEVEEAVRFSFNSKSITVKYDTTTYDINNVNFVDTNFFDVFDFRMIRGNPDTALQSPFAIVVSQKVANQFFGNQNPIGKSLQFPNNSYTITGVFDKLTGISHLQPDILISLNSVGDTLKSQMREDWTHIWNYTYLKFRKGTDIEAFQEKLNAWQKKEVAAWTKKYELKLQLLFSIERIDKVHFNTSLSYDFESNTSFSYIYIFAMVGVFLLVLASINYMNLATAHSLKRAREVAIRKTVGANIYQLIVQFIGESIIICFIALIIALAANELLLPLFSELAEKPPEIYERLYSIKNIWFWSGCFIGVLLLGIISGSYPAFILSQFSPAAVLKSSIPIRRFNYRFLNSDFLRKALVVFQFIISISMIISTSVVYSQMQFMKNKDLGFQQNDIIIAEFVYTDSLLQKIAGIKKKLSEYQNIEDIITAGNVPGEMHGRLMFFIEKDSANLKQQTINVFAVENDFFDFFDIKMLQGEGFKDTTKGVVINQAVADMFGWTNPMEKSLVCGRYVGGKVLGVVENFHYTSLHNPIEPLVFFKLPQATHYMAIKIKRDEQTTLAYIKEVWEKYFPGYDFKYSYLDKNFKKQYKYEEQLMLIFSYFSLLTICIALLGLYGLTTHIMEQRYKEICIRKVLGASVYKITVNQMKQFIRWIFIAGCIASGIVYFTINLWLDTFPYRVKIQWHIFILAIFSVLLVAFLTIIFQTIKAANKSPVTILRNE